MRSGFVALLFLLIGLVPARADGQITVHFEPSKTQLGENIRAIPEFTQAWVETAKLLNDTFKMPHDLPVVFMDIGQPNAFYTSDKHAIVVGYEMLADLARVYKPMAKDDTELGNDIIGGIFFIFFHEFGHALVGEMNLPTVGREEDAVDEFSALLLADADQFGQSALVSAAAYFAKTATEPTPDQYFDEHSLNLQRVSTIVTILYASNPQRWAPMCKDMGIQDRTLQLAVRDYPRKQKAWEALLASHLKPGAKF